MSKDENSRKRGVLTPADREFIQNPDEYSRQATYNRETEIQRRAANALLDYPLLIEFGEYDAVLEEVDSGLVEALKAQVAFVYKTAKEAGFHAEDLIDDAIEEAKESRIDVLKQRFESDPESLTISELSDLYTAGELSEEAYNEFFHEHLRRPIGNVDPEDDDVDVLDRLGEHLGEDNDE